VCTAVIAAAFSVAVKALKKFEPANAVCTCAGVVAAFTLPTTVESAPPVPVPAPTLTM